MSVTNTKIALAIKHEGLYVIKKEHSQPNDKLEEKIISDQETANLPNHPNMTNNTFWDLMEKPAWCNTVFQPLHLGRIWHKVNFLSGV